MSFNEWLLEDRKSVLRQLFLKYGISNFDFKIENTRQNKVMSSIIDTTIKELEKEYPQEQIKNICMLYDSITIDDVYSTQDELDNNHDVVCIEYDESHDPIKFHLLKPTTMEFINWYYDTYLKGGN